MRKFSIQLIKITLCLCHCWGVRGLWSDGVRRDAIECIRVLKSHQLILHSPVERVWRI